MSVQCSLLEAVEGIAIDVVIGGPPCQAFSQVRNHNRIIGDPRNKLYRHYIAIIRNIRPKLFVMENVPGLQNLGGGSVRRQILDDLTLDGEYRVASEVVDAAAFGVPQNRLRVLFVGVRADLGIEPRFPEVPEFPELPQLERLPARAGGTEHNRSLLTEAARSALLDPEDFRLVTVKQAIGDLAYLQPCQKLVRKPSDDPLPYETAAQSAYQRARRAGSRELFNADVPSNSRGYGFALAGDPSRGEFPRPSRGALSALPVREKVGAGTRAEEPEFGNTSLLTESCTLITSAGRSTPSRIACFTTIALGP